MASKSTSRLTKVGRVGNVATEVQLVTNNSGNGNFAGVLESAQQRKVKSRVEAYSKALEQIDVQSIASASSSGSKKKMRKKVKRRTSTTSVSSISSDMSVKTDCSLRLVSTPLPASLDQANQIRNWSRLSSSLDVEEVESDRYSVGARTPLATRLSSSSLEDAVVRDPEATSKSTKSTTTKSTKSTTTKSTTAKPSSSKSTAKPSSKPKSTSKPSSSSKPTSDSWSSLFGYPNMKQPPAVAVSNAFQLVAVDESSTARDDPETSVAWLTRISPSLFKDDYNEDEFEDFRPNSYSWEDPMLDQGFDVTTLQHASDVFDQVNSAQPPKEADWYAQHQNPVEEEESFLEFTGGNLPKCEWDEWWEWYQEALAYSDSMDALEDIDVPVSVCYVTHINSYLLDEEATPYVPWEQEAWQTGAGTTEHTVPRDSIKDLKPHQKALVQDANRESVRTSSWSSDSDSTLSGSILKRSSTSSTGKKKSVRFAKKPLSVNYTVSFYDDDEESVLSMDDDTPYHNQQSDNPIFSESAVLCVESDSECEDDEEEEDWVDGDDIIRVEQDEDDHDFVDESVIMSMFDRHDSNTSWRSTRSAGSASSLGGNHTSPSEQDDPETEQQQPTEFEQQQDDDKLDDQSVGEDVAEETQSVEPDQDDEGDEEQPALDDEPVDLSSGNPMFSGDGEDSGPPTDAYSSGNPMFSGDSQDDDAPPAYASGNPMFSEDALKPSDRKRSRSISKLVKRMIPRRFSKAA